MLTRIRKSIGIVLLLAALLAVSTHSAEKITWKPISDAILEVDSLPVKLWNMYHAGKKFDPLLLQLGTRYLVIYIHNQQVYEIKPEKLEHKGEDLLWRDSDKPEKPLPTSDWNTRDIGAAIRIRLKLAEEGRQIEIQLPQLPDLRGLY